MKRYSIPIVATLLIGYCSSCLAYIGPGAGISFFGSLLTTLIVIVLAVFAVLFWPVRYLWRRWRKQKINQQVLENTSTEENTTNSSAGSTSNS